MLSFIRNALRDRERERTKQHWRNLRWTSCTNSERMFEAIDLEQRSSLRRILEFGCDHGGNLRYFMDRLPEVSAVGIDLREAARSLEAEYSRYTGIVGDEQALTHLRDDEFDLAFTVSVLDHLSDRVQVEDAIDQLLRVSPHVLLLEPWIEGVEGDVSNKTRNEVARGLPNGHKRFAATCYLWDYGSILDRRAVEWTRTPMPLHLASLGPFYQLYDVRRQRASRP